MINIVEIFFPKCCPGCGSLLYKSENRRGFCDKCSKEIRIARGSVCLKCGKILNNNTKEFCKSCEKTRHSFTQGKALFGYTGPIKLAMYRFKYSNKRAYGRIFAQYAKKEYGAWIRKKGIEAIIPIPMYEKKKRVRGYNQAEVFGNELSKATGIPCEANIVKRKRDTAPMKQLNERQRVNNLQNAFTIDENVVKFSKVLLVDDIYTTGATMDSVAAELLKAGVLEVYCLSVSTAIE